MRGGRQEAVEGELAAVRSRITALGLSDRFTVPGALSTAEVRDITAAGAGRAVTPGPAAVAEAVLTLLDPATNTAASTAARELAAKSFSMDAVLDTLLGIYEGIGR
ncbi:hypothetical protein [Streptomyces sp. NPDC059564]|uniref:hypothetical protein n=1 Tax=Streptomyces sp. NPDC059564 TaxID=3346865 RepID=UPI00368C3C17